MNKKLPNVYVKKNNKLKDNNKEIFYEKSNPLDKDKTEIDALIIRKKINEILNSTSFVYKAKVKISFKDKDEIHTIIGQNKNYLLTIDNNSIKIDDILNIEVI